MIRDLELTIAVAR